MTSTSDSPRHPTQSKPCIVEPLHIEVEDDPYSLVPGFLHLLLTASASASTPSTATTAAIILFGAGGGIAGPWSIHLSLADKLALLRHHPFLKCAGIQADRSDHVALAEKLIEYDEKNRLMVRGGDLRRNESTE